MVQLSILFLVHVCPALLTPTDPDDRDYYDILGISRDSSNEAIRKAYKKKSLQLHPDKVQQRGGNQDEARAEYEQVQEAYGGMLKIWCLFCELKIVRQGRILPCAGTVYSYE